MAYKFQLGSARLSGSTTFEQPLVVESTFSATSLSSSAGLQVGGTVELDGVADAAVAVGADSFYYLDATDGLMKSDTMADYATAIAGDGLTAAAGVLKVDVSDFAGTSLEDDGSENLRISTAAAGDGLGGGGASALSVNVDGSGIEIDSDALRLKDNGVTLAKMAGLARGNFIIGDSNGDPSALAIGTAAQLLVSDGDTLLYRSLSGDATINAAGVLSIGATKVTDAMINDDVAVTLAGDGLTAASGVLAIQVSGAIKLTSDKLGLTGSIAGKGLQFEGGADSLSSLEVKVASSGGITKGAGSSQKSLALDMNGLNAAVVNVANDSFAIVDADDSNKTKKESIADFMAAVAGDGLAASSGVLAVGVDDSTIETSGDALRLKDAGITLAKMAANSVDSDQYVDGSIDLIHMSANSVDSDQYVDGSIDLIHMSANSVDSDQYVDGSIDTDHIADNQVTLAKMAGLARGKFIVGDSSGDPSALALGSAHQFLQSDGTDLAYVSMSGDATLVAGVLSIGATKVTDAMINDDVAVTLAGVGLSAASGVVAVDLNELSAAAIDVANDSFALIDANDSNGSKKESFADYATAIAGTGLTAVSGVLNARLDVAAKADGGTLAAGVNYFADLTGNATVTLPASPAEGDTVVVKAKGLSSAVIIINKAGSQTIDGEASVTIESPYGAVTMVYVAANDWRLV
jgi:hypothetical protein